nr:trichoplein keratin filament-binding protein isoform X1 [Nothobranchius furzeri]XP_015828125.2 trichoplein keratin filament-binding protein isoform X1 [Nothobranchius furzeri]
MAFPTRSVHLSSRNRCRVLEEQKVQRREREAQQRHQWELHSRYLKEQEVRCQQQAAWSCQRCFQQSMSAYHHLEEEEQRKAFLWRHRGKLRTMLQEERDQLEAELRQLVPDKTTRMNQMVQKAEELHSAREETRKKIAQELLREHWKRNNAELRQAESALHKDHVVSRWQEQVSEKKQKEVTEREEKRRFENEHERTRKEAQERMKQAEERQKEEERRRAEALRQQMEELKMREEETSRLKKEQQVLMMQQVELDKIEEERKKIEDRRKKAEMGSFLIRQYKAQLRRKAQQVQEELEVDRKIMAALLEGEEEDQRLKAARRERAVADAAWMKSVLEEQLKLEREREAEFETVHREDAQRVWEKREAQWEKEKKARERLMHEVLVERQRQLEEKMQRNREAQESSLKRREELIQELEKERELRRLEKEQHEGRKTTRMQELDAQVEQRHQEEMEEQRRREREQEEDREALRIQEEQLRLEMQKMAVKGYQEKIHNKPLSVPGHVLSGRLNF